jgi:hypothetical protein
MKILHILIAIFVTTMTALPLLGTSILIQQPEVVVKQAPLIVEVVIKDIKFKPISSLSTGEAWITLTVIEKIVGECPSEILIRRGDVTPDLQFLETEWDPPYSLGEHFIICLFPTAHGYSTMGLYNGKFVIQEGLVKGTQISLEEFKRRIQEIRSGQRSEFPSDLPRQTSSGVQQGLHKVGKESKVMSWGHTSVGSSSHGISPGIHLTFQSRCIIILPMPRQVLQTQTRLQLSLTQLTHFGQISIRF